MIDCYTVLVVLASLVGGGFVVELEVKSENTYVDSAAQRAKERRVGGVIFSFPATPPLPGDLDKRRRGAPFFLFFLLFFFFFFFLSLLPPLSFLFSFFLRPGYALRRLSTCK